VADNFYYLLASLPSPIFAQAPVMGFAEYRQICADLADPETAAAVSACVLLPPSPDSPEFALADPFLRNFWTRERIVRNELVRMRAQKLGQKAEGFLRGLDSAPAAGEAVQVALSAFQAADPFEAETLLAKSSFDWVDQASSCNHYDRVALIAYGLKILIIERFARFEATQGKARYSAFYQTILENAPAREWR
jgi:hypothetical protein